MKRTDKDIEKLKGYRDFLLEHYDRCPAIIQPKLNELNKIIGTVK